MKKQANKTTLQILFSLFAALILVACSGGGGSGSGAPPQKITFTTSNPSSGALTEDSVIHASLSETAGFEASLNGVDISSLFVNDGDGSDNKKRKINVYALQGILAETGKGTLTAKVNGSREEKLQITYHGKPDVAFKNVMGGIDTSFTSENVLLFLKDGKKPEPVEPSESASCAPDECYEVKVPKNAGFSVAHANVNAEGIVLNALLESISRRINGNGSTGDFEKTGTKAFSVKNFYFPEQVDNKTASFQVDVESNGKMHPIKFAIPGKTISNAMVLQLSDMDEHHAISEWVSEALVNYIQTLNEKFLNEDQPIASIENEDACQIFNAFNNGMNAGSEVCVIDVTKVSWKGDSSPFKVSVNFLQYDENFWSGGSNALILQVKVETDIPLQVESTITGYKENGFDKVIDAEFEFRNMKPEMAIKIGLGKPANGADVLAIDIHYDESGNKTESMLINSGVGVIIPTPSSCERNDGVICSNRQQLNSNVVKEAVDKAMADGAAKAAYCLQPYTVNASDYSAQQDIDDFNDKCGFAPTIAIKPWANIGEKREKPVFLNPKAENKTVTSAKEEKLSDSRFVAVAPEKGSGAGFVSFSGYHKTREDGVHRGALGTSFISPVAGQVSQDKLIKEPGSDAVVALSSNWINQNLLSMYQSDQFNREITDTVAELGLLSMLGGIPGISKDGSDEVKITITSKVAPTINLINYAGVDYVELVTYNVDIRVQLMKDMSSICTGFGSLGGCTPLLDNKYPYVDVSVDLKARLKPNELITGKATALAADDIMVHISKASGTKVTVPEGLGIEGFDPKAKDLQSMLYPMLRKQLSEDLTWETIESTIAFCGNSDNELLNSVLDSLVVPDSKKTFNMHVASAKLDKLSGDKAEHILLTSNIVADTGAQTQAEGLHLLQLVLDNNCATPTP